MGSELAVASGLSSARARCSHHWVIEDTMAETSTGTCRLCGEQRCFSNCYQPAVPKDDANRLRRGSGDGGPGDRRLESQDTVTRRVERLFQMMASQQDYQVDP